MDVETIRIRPGLTIPLGEVRFRYGPSNGPGGQNVNRLATRAELIFDMDASAALTEEQKARIREKLAAYVNGRGLLCLSSQRTRSQLQNRRDVIDRFAALVRQALHRPKPRRPTRPTRSSQERRLAAKRLRGRTKHDRAATADDL